MRRTAGWVGIVLLCAVAAPGARAEEKTEDARLAPLMQKDAVAALLPLLEEARGGALLERLASRKARAAVTIPADVRESLVEARRVHRAALVSRCRARNVRNLVAVRIASKRVKAAELAIVAKAAAVERYQRRAARYERPRPASLKALETSLRANEVLVLYLLRETESIALVVESATSESAASGAVRSRMVKLAPSATLVGLTNGLRAAFLEAGSSAAAREAALTAARRALVAPLGLLASAKRVLLSLDGALHAAPVEQLFPGPAYRVISGSILALGRAEARATGHGVLALVDPDYKHAVAGLRHTSRFSSLPATRAEASAVRAVTLSGKDATEAGLLSAVAQRPRWRAIHFACHGLLRTKDPLWSGLALAVDEHNDGILTALEVLESALPADLVVLSATHMAGGALVAGEGLVSPAHAFLVAGARAVLAPLGNVDDAATAFLMSRFYAHGAAQKGGSAAEALRLAQADLAKHPTWSHPYYWAGWVLLGDPE